MIRIIVRETDSGEACNVPNGQTHLNFKTFDVELPEVEKYLSEKWQYVSRQVIGVEVVTRPPEGK